MNPRSVGSFRDTERRMVSTRIRIRNTLVRRKRNDSAFGNWLSLGETFTEHEHRLQRQERRRQGHPIQGHHRSDGYFNKICLLFKASNIGRNINSILLRLKLNGFDQKHKNFSAEGFASEDRPLRVFASGEDMPLTILPVRRTRR